MTTKQEIIDFCLSFADVYEDYPFDEEWAAIRHSANKKCFAYVYERNGSLCVNLKCEPFKADFLRQIFENITPGYHMNKMHWNTITIGGDVPDSELCGMIAHSYDRIKPKTRAKLQIPWPENLYRELLGDKYTTTPTNAEEAIDYVLNEVIKPRNHKRAISMTLARFKEGKTYSAIGVDYGIGTERVRQLVKKSLRILRSPSRLRYIVGLEQAKEYAKLTKSYDQFLRDVNSRYVYGEQALVW